LQAGDHPFINRNSFVLFQFSMVERRVTIQAGLDQGRFVQREDLPEPNLTDIENGLLRSRYTPRKVKNYLAL